MRDRLCIEKKYDSLVVDKIDESQYLGLDKTNSDRIDLFMFALALGIKDGHRTPLTNKLGWILKTSAERQTESMAEIFALWIQEAINDNQEDKIDDTEAASNLAEEYANTGFRILYNALNQKTVPSMYSYIKDMDARFEEIVNESK